MTSLAVLGFMGYMILNRATTQRAAAGNAPGARAREGRLGAGTLAVHSVLDGAGIGLGYQVSPVVGLLVAVAVLSHDFSDGINTVGLILKSGGTRTAALRWLLVDAAAPLVGVAATLAVRPAPDELGAALAVFCGFFLYIGASDLLPEAYHAHPTRMSTVATLLGAGLMYVAIELARR